MTLLGCVLYVELIACFGLLCLFLFIFLCFYMVVFYQFFFLVSKIQKHIKSRKFKNLIEIVEFYHKHVLPCTFVLMALCIYEHNLYPMHLYHCGRTLDIYVTVVNRSSNLSSMISEWFCWSWYMHRLVPIYLPTHLFIYLFCFKELSNVNFHMKRDNELQKPVTHTSIWLGKKESDQKCMIPKKPKACSSSEMSKISSINLTMRCYDSKRSNYMMYMEPNEKLQSFVIKLCGRSYMHISIIEMGHII